MKLSEMQAALNGLKSNPFWVAYQDRLVHLHGEGMQAITNGVRLLPESALRSAVAELKAIQEVISLPVLMLREAEQEASIVNHQEDGTSAD